jgi:hypothetical protein
MWLGYNKSSEVSIDLHGDYPLMTSKECLL